VAELRQQLRVPLVPKPFTIDELLAVVADTMTEMRCRPATHARPLRMFANVPTHLPKVY
jgi:hypothetical protein